jgi:ribosomal protein L37AE/L43A
VICPTCGESDAIRQDDETSLWFCFGCNTGGTWGAEELIEPEPQPEQEQLTVPS